MIEQIGDVMIERDVQQTLRDAGDAAAARGWTDEAHVALAAARSRWRGRSATRRRSAALASLLGS